MEPGLSINAGVTFVSFRSRPADGCATRIASIKVIAFTAFILTPWDLNIQYCWSCVTVYLPYDT